MPHYFTDTKQPLNPNEITILLLGNSLKLLTAGGVFSPKSVDFGTKVMIEHAILPSHGRILNLGCGYGPVGIAVAKAHPEATVLMTDCNPRATTLAKMNAKRNETTNATVRTADIYDGIAETFDSILCNPPQAAGKKVCFAMIEGAPAHLNDGGSLYIIARRNTGGVTLSHKMEDVFGNVDVIVKSGGFWLYRSISKKL